VIRTLVVATLSAIGLAACGTTASTTPPFAPASPVPRHAGLEQGLRLLAAGNHGGAIRELNRALARAPEDAHLHLLAGLAYHLGAARGNPASLELAEVGYSVASQLSPSSHLAQVQLGRLHLDNRNYLRAQRAFARVLDLERDHAPAALGLATASYYAGDLDTALGAIALAERLRPDHRHTLRASALIRSAAGLDAEARASQARLQSAGIEGDELRFVERRMAQWRDLRRDARLGQEPLVLAQAGASQATPPNVPPQGGVIAAHWADCGTGLQQVASVAGAGSGADETTPLAALPSPCAGQSPPRMVQIDATYIVSEESIETSKGVNLLQGLQVVFGASRSLVRTLVSGTPSSQTITTNRSMGLPQAGVTYSLNIANAADLRADVLARPTLLALDRMPAQFFSGTTVSVAIPGNLGGGSLVEKPIGVSMSVTPTFIDDETILVAVKIARSAVEVGQPGSFEQALHTTRNVVNSTAVMKFDQTLILTGLIERESVYSKAGIPGLRDVPVVQYLASTAGTEELQKSVLVTITPRRVALAGPASGAAGGAEPADPVLAEVRERLLRDHLLPSNALATMGSLRANRYMSQFRHGDLKDDDWKAPESMEEMFRAVRRFLHY
jgi:hypothetical protein